MPTPVLLAKATITMTEASIIAWRKQVGEVVSKDEILFEMETDKVIVEVPAPVTGILLRIDIAEGAARVGQPIGWIGFAGEPIPAIAAGPTSTGSGEMASSPAQSTTFQAEPRGTASSSPAARRRAKELGVELASLRGTGPGGRITEADVEDAAHKR